MSLWRIRKSRARRRLVLVLAAVIAASVGAGCGGGGEQQTARSSKPSVLVAALGDSVTAGAPKWDPNPVQRRRLKAAPDSKNQYEYWLERRSGGRARVRNCGVSGDLTAHMARRLKACTAGARVLIIQGGGNDIVLGLGVAQTARNLERMVRRGKQLHLRVLLADIVPFGGKGSWRRQVKRLNMTIGGIGKRNRVPVLRFHDTLEDPSNPGRYRPGLTDDFIHPSVEGHKRIAALIQLPGRSQDVEAPSP